jgi:hypothetical protein
MLRCCLALKGQSTLEKLPCAGTQTKHIGCEGSVLGANEFSEGHTVDATSSQHLPQAFEDAPQTKRWSKSKIQPSLEAVMSALLVRAAYLRRRCHDQSHLVMLTSLTDRFVACCACHVLHARPKPTDRRSNLVEEASCRDNGLEASRQH